MHRLYQLAAAGYNCLGAAVACALRSTTKIMNMSKVKLLAGLSLTLLVWTSVQAQSVVSRFEGSVEKGIYEADYDAFVYLDSLADGSTIQRVEGSIISRVFVKPAEKSNLELFRSYERELAAAGFTTVISETPSRPLQQRISTMYRTSAGHAWNSYRPTEDRVIGSDLARIETFPDYYIVAQRTRGDAQLTLGIIISRDQNLYLIEEVTAAAMETGTVTLNIEAMRSEIEESGKIAVYDIRFATGSAVIEPESADALAVIAGYLTDTAGGFYIVGHTDDTGTLDANLDLSQQRAAAVKTALVTEHGIGASRLETRGVGPLAPVSNNTGDAGRTLNRRVEIVQRLP